MKRRETKKVDLFKRKINICVGDTVVVLAGDDKGKTGKVLHVNRRTGRIQIENIAMHQRYVAVNRNVQNSAKVINSQAGYIDVSNVKKITSIKEQNENTI